MAPEIAPVTAQIISVLPPRDNAFEIASSKLSDSIFNHTAD